MLEDEGILQKSITFGDYRVVIQLPKCDEDLSNTKDNNIVCFKSGKIIWEIKQLLECFSKNNDLKYFNELYFDISKESDKILKCTGFYNHCVIDVYKQKIISIINNR